LVAAACIAVPVCATGAEGPAIVTLLEGQAAVLRGTTRYALLEGVRLQSGDIVEVNDNGLAQIEFVDDTILSLGPRTRLYVATLVARGAKAGAMSDFYFMQGWSKFTLGKAAAPLRLTTPHLGLASTGAVTVLQVESAEASMFVESGEVRLAEGFTKATPTSPVQVRGGQFYSRKGDQKGVIQARPTTTFISAMPKHYLDNLPVRAAKYKERDVAPRRVEELDYAGAEMWLKAPLDIRKSIMQRFLPKAEEPAFRQAVIANMRFHPEWDRIIFPEKYRPKPPPEPEPLPPIVYPPPSASPPVAAPIPAPPPASREPKPAQPSLAWPPVEGAGAQQKPRNQ
jgi:hypothetical protein